MISFDECSIIFLELNCTFLMLSVKKLKKTFIWVNLNVKREEGMMLVISKKTDGEGGNNGKFKRSIRNCRH